VREDHWVIADLLGKAGHIRTVPVPGWVKDAIDEWKEASGITEGTLFRAINRMGRVWGMGMTPKVLWDVVREAASWAGIEKLAPHDLRRTCARLCRLAGGELDQIQFLLGHVSIQTMERYPGASRSCAAQSTTGSVSSRRRLDLPIWSRVIRHLPTTRG
jgi:integrase